MINGIIDENSKDKIRKKMFDSSEDHEIIFVCHKRALLPAFAVPRLSYNWHFMMSSGWLLVKPKCILKREQF